MLITAACGGKKKKSAEQKVSLKTSKDSASYAAGLNEGERMYSMIQQTGADTIFDLKLFADGFADYIKQKPALTKEQAQKALMNLFANLEKGRQNEFAGLKEEGEKFLADNAKKEGVTTTSTGLQYEVLKKGSGPVVKIGDVVKVHYTGTLLDGSKVDSSKDAGEPFEFELQPAGLIQGWIEALQLMNKGSVYKLYVPYELGYGDRGKAPKVPPFSVLVFELELVDHQAK